MTIRRQWLLVLVLSVLISVSVNTVVLSSLINNYFIDYSTDNYNKNISRLLDFSKEALSVNAYSSQQLEMQLETFLSDPINRIRLYDANGNLIANVTSKEHQGMGRMRNGIMNGMMNHMMGNTSEEVYSADIEDNGVIIGKVNITKYSSIGNSLETRKFTYSLIASSILSFAIVFVLILVIAAFVSKKMSGDLMRTAQQAIDIDLGNQKDITKSKVKEIRTIQISLETLQNRLKLKQISRKKLVDELVHQTRTPLTILRTHLEGYEDGIIDLTPEEIRTCEAQIDNISIIITNMSEMIDAEKDADIVRIEQFELSHLLKQIIGGLKVQFQRKAIDLQLLSTQKVLLKTDLNKLSQSIYNLLTNAYKFTEANGRVTVEYKQVGDELTLVVKDTGRGICEDDQNKIFDAYYRGNNSANTVGEGIGLYLVSENIKKIDGHIELQSKLGEGSRFIIKIPREI